MVEKGIRGGICHSIYGYEKPNNKYTKDYDKNEESSYLKYWDVNNLYGWAMSQKLPVNNFEISKILISLMNISQKAIMKKVMMDIFLIFNMLKNYMIFIMI